MMFILHTIWALEQQSPAANGNFRPDNGNVVKFTF